MGIITDDLITELGAHLGIDISDNSTELDTDQAILLLNRSYWKLLDKYPFREKEVSTQILTIAGIRNYDVVNPFEALRQLSIYNSSSEIFIPLNRGTIYTHEQDRPLASNLDGRGFPTDYLREGNKIRLKPVPDDVYTINMKYLTLLDDLEISQFPNIPQSWHEIILYGAIGRGYLRMRDFESANTFFNMAAGEIKDSVSIEAKEETDSHTAGLEVLGRDDCNWR